MLAGMMARPARDLLAHELRRDVLGDRRAEALAVGQLRFRLRQRGLAAEVLAMRDVDHLLGDDAGLGELVLGDGMAGGAARCALFPSPLWGEG